MANVKGGAIATTQQNRAGVSQNVTTLKNMIKQMEGQIAKALPKVMTPERFTRIVMTALSANEQLRRCTPQSFLGAMMQAAQLGVEPNTPLGQAYLIPYGNQVQFQLGYRGLIDLAYRSGEITSIQAHEVYENDTFEYELGLEPKLRHIPALADRGKVILYYAVFHTKSGGYAFEVMSKEDIERHVKQFSKAAGSGFSPWKDNFDSMAKKTVVKRLLKYAPLKSEFAQAMAADETIKTKITEDILDQPNEMVYESEAEEVPDNVDPETGEITGNEE